MPPVSSSSIERSVPVQNECDIVLVQVEALKVASLAGFPKLAGWAFATAASEAASNALKHGGGGCLFLRFSRGEEGCLEFEAVDQGPGFAGTAGTPEEGFSTLKDEAYPSRSGGLGNGLPTISRLMDSLAITSTPGQGSKVTARKRLS